MLVLRLLKLALPLNVPLDFMFTLVNFDDGVGSGVDVDAEAGNINIYQEKQKQSSSRIMARTRWPGRNGF